MSQNNFIMNLILRILQLYTSLVVKTLMYRIPKSYKLNNNNISNCSNTQLILIFLGFVKNTKIKLVESRFLGFDFSRLGFELSEKLKSFSVFYEVKKRETNACLV